MTIHPLTTDRLKQKLETIMKLMEILDQTIFELDLHVGNSHLTDNRDDRETLTLIDDPDLGVKDLIGHFSQLANIQLVSGESAGPTLAELARRIVAKL